MEKTRDSLEIPSSESSAAIRRSRQLFPRWWVPALTVTEAYFHVVGKVCIEYWSPACLFLMGFGQRNAFGDIAAHWLGSVKDRHGSLTAFDDDLCAGTHTGHQGRKVARCFDLRNVDYILCHNWIIHRCPSISLGRAGYEVGSSARAVVRRYHSTVGARRYLMRLRVASAAAVLPSFSCAAAS